ncbi:hypothetical protein [Nonomuraea jabiensis]|uniref:hypothetical protein n=1 Tax=Nonomuraea jabiensis TaxID=882448 RepID=UPI001C8873DB|nr:hypothetical protein [Nonomuraea jabiensis]
MAERVHVREIDDDEGRRLLRIIRRGTGSVVTWRRAQMVLLSAQGMPMAKIAEVTFTSADRVRDAKPTEHDLPFSTWSLTKLADFLVAEAPTGRSCPRRTSPTSSSAWRSSYRST